MKKLTKSELNERKEALKPSNWNYPMGTTLIVTASGTVTLAPRTSEEWEEFIEKDMYVEGYNLYD